MRNVDKRPKIQAWFLRLKEKQEALEALLAEVEDHWNYEDLTYRFFHTSFKMFRFNTLTKKIVLVLAGLSPSNDSILAAQPEKPGLPDSPDVVSTLPALKLNERFLGIVRDGLSRKFDRKTTNQNWDKETRPVVEAFFHAHYMLRMAVKYSRELEEPPNLLPSGYAALLYLYNLR